MNDKVTISTFQLMELFPDEAAARAYLEKRRWPDGVCCPTCGVAERITTRGGKANRADAEHVGRRLRLALEAIAAAWWPEHGARPRWLPPAVDNPGEHRY
jgi:hypothetical protein